MKLHRSDARRCSIALSGSLIRGFITITLLAGSLAGLAGRFLLTAHAGGVLTPAAPYTANQELADTLISLDYDIPDPSIAGGFVDVYYHVADPSGTPADGRVRVSGLNSYGCEGWLVRGQGGCRLLGSIAGPDSFVAAYSGNGILAPSTSVPEIHLVEKADTMTRVTWDDPDPSVKGQPLLIRVSVAGIHSDVSRPTGSVVVKAGMASCSITLKYGVGACALTFTGTGKRKITATYLGDASYNSSTSQAEFHTVILQPTQTPTMPPPTPTATATPTATRPGSLPPGPAGAKSPTPPPATMIPTITVTPRNRCSETSRGVGALKSVEGVPLPDLAVSWMQIGVEHGSRCYVPGNPYGLIVVIANLGPAPAGRFVVNMDQEERVVDGMDANSYKSVFFQHLPGSYGGYSACVMLDTTDAVPESDETNNQFGQRLPILTQPPPCVPASLTPSPMP